MFENYNPTNENAYLNDASLAEYIDVSPSWVRKQRYLRKKGEDHSLTVDAIYIGNSPRYKASEINKWLEALATTNKGAYQCQ